MVITISVIYPSRLAQGFSYRFVRFPLHYLGFILVCGWISSFFLPTLIGGDLSAAPPGHKRRGSKPKFIYQSRSQVLAELGSAKKVVYSSDDGYEGPLYTVKVKEIPPSWSPPKAKKLPGEAKGEELRPEPLVGNLPPVVKTGQATMPGSGGKKGSTPTKVEKGGKLRLSSGPTPPKGGAGAARRRGGSRRRKQIFRKRWAWIEKILS